MNRGDPSHSLLVAKRRILIVHRLERMRIYQFRVERLAFKRFNFDDVA